MRKPEGDELLKLKILIRTMVVEYITKRENPHDDFIFGLGCGMSIMSLMEEELTDYMQGFITGMDISAYYQSLIKEALADG